MQEPKRLPFEEFKAIYSKVPRLCLEIALQTPEGLVLTLRNLPSWHGQWHLPGGGMLYGETVQEGIARIARDELGITVTVQKLLGYCEYPSEEKERGFGRAVSMIFLCTSDAAIADMKTDAQASDVRAFREIPGSTVAEQREFLIAHTAELW